MWCLLGRMMLNHTWTVFKPLVAWWLVRGFYYPRSVGDDNHPSTGNPEKRKKQQQPGFNGMRVGFCGHCSHFVGKTRCQSWWSAIFIDLTPLWHYLYVRPSLQVIYKQNITIIWPSKESRKTLVWLFDSKHKLDIVFTRSGNVSLLHLITIFIIYLFTYLNNSWAC